MQIFAVSAGTVLDFAEAQPITVALNGVTGITVANYVSRGAQYFALSITKSKAIKVTGFHAIDPGAAGIETTYSDTVDIAAPWVTGSGQDGIDVGPGSTNVTVHDGAVEGTNNVPGGHPDCVEGWSAAGAPVMHFIVKNMTCIGATMGFDFWDHTDLGATDIEFIGNAYAGTAANCVGVINAHQLVVSANRCETLPGGTVGSARVNVVSSPGAVTIGNTQEGNP